MQKLPKLISEDDFRKSDSTSSTSLRRKSSTSPLKLEMTVSKFVDKLEGERQKLMSVESQRVIAVLDDAIQCLQVISRFGSVCENYDYFEQLIGPELAALFLQLCVSLKYEINEDEDYDIPKYAFEDAEVVTSMNEMSAAQKLAAYSTPALRRIRDAVKTIVRLLLEKKAILSTVLMDTTPSTAMIDLLQTIEELRKFMYVKLRTTETKEKERLRFLENAPNRERMLRDKIEKLEMELAEVKASGTQQVNQLTEKIEQLEDDIEKMVTISSEAILQRRMETFQEIEQEERASKDEQVSLLAEQEVFQKKYAAMLDKNRQTELNMRKKNFKISCEVENWVQKYDKDMLDRLAVLESVTAEYEKEKAELQRVEREFAPIERAYKVLMTEKSEEEKKKLAKMASNKKFVRAAVVIQKYARGWLARMWYKQKKSKKK